MQLNAKQLESAVSNITLRCDKLLLVADCESENNLRPEISVVSCTKWWDEIESQTLFLKSDFSPGEK